MAISVALFLAIYHLCSANNLFKYLKSRYSHQQVQGLNRLLRLKAKSVKSLEHIRFLRQCLDLYVSPNHIKIRRRRSKPKNPSAIERAFIRDEIARETDFSRLSQEQFAQEWADRTKPLSFLDRLRFRKFISNVISKEVEQLRKKNDRALERMVGKQHGTNNLKTSVLVNLAKVDLSDLEKEVLCRGLGFGIPSKTSKEEVHAEFELCWQQLDNLEPVSADKKAQCKTAMADYSQQYANAKIDKTGFPLTDNHLKAIKQLKNSKDLIITRPDKGNGVVLLDRTDYINKMNSILQTDKFMELGNANEQDRTLQEERALQAFLLRAHKKGDISKEVYERIRPVGTTRPRMYGVPKIHKPGVPLRPILSMINSPHHETAKWLAEVLRPVVQLYSEHTLNDTFHFCQELESFISDGEHSVKNTFMCSFDIASLFTNIPLAETIDICLDALYRNQQLSPPSVPEALLKKLLFKTTTEVEFSFNNILYKQVDGVAMGSPLGPVLANIFVGFCESKVDPTAFPLLYRRYVDDTFSMFLTRPEAIAFHGVLNSMHPSLTFTMEMETDGKLPFLDVDIQRVDDTLIRSVYRKPTFSGLYTRWDSFCDTRQKINLVKSLTSRAIKICSPATLEGELNNLRRIFSENGYPDDIVNNTMKRVKDASTASLNTSSTPPAEGEPSDKLVTLKLPWKGRISARFRKDIERTVRESFRVHLRVYFSTKKAFSPAVKDVLPTTMQSNVVYQFTCHCKGTYVGRTSQQLGERIKQHIPPKLLSTPPASWRWARSDSAITKHLKENAECAQKNTMANAFKILARARHQRHLEILEAAFIQSTSPSLCQQKDLGKYLLLGT